MKIKSVIIFSNGVVMSFNDKGEQVSECEGLILDIADKLKEFVMKTRNGLSERSMRES